MTAKSNFSPPLSHCRGKAYTEWKGRSELLIAPHFTLLLCFTRFLYEDISEEKWTTNNENDIQEGVISLQ